MTVLYKKDPIIDDLYNQIIILRKLPKDVKQEIIVDKLFIGKDTTPDRQSDFDRIVYLKNNPSAWHIDADILIKKWPDFKLEKGFVYLYQERGLLFDTCVTLANGQTDYFEYLYKECCIGDRYIHTVIEEDLKDRTKPIPSGYFEHCVLHGVAEQIKSGTDRNYLNCRRHGFEKIDNKWKFKY